MKHKNRKLPKATRTEELNKRSERKFEDLFCYSSGFHTTKVPLESDKGIDFFVNILDQYSNVLPDKFIAQLKSTHKATYKDSYVLAKGFPVKTINLMRSDTLPAYVFYYELGTDIMYWGKLNCLLDVVRSKKIKWQEQETTTMFFDVHKIVNKENLQVIYEDTRRECANLVKIKSDHELLESLLPYCDVNVKCTKKGRNIIINPIKSGFGGRFSFKAKNAEMLRDFQRKGFPCSLPIDSGKLVFTYQNNEICSIDNIEKIEILQQKVPVEIIVKKTNVSAGLFSFSLEKKKDVSVICSEKDNLPWYIAITLNNKTKEANIKFKFYREFAAIEEYLKFLTFIKSLGEQKYVVLKNFLGKEIDAEISINNTPNIQEWEIQFFKYLLVIEKYMMMKFHIPETVEEQDYENAYILSSLFDSGEAYLPNMRLSYTFLGRHLKEQMPTLAEKGKELIFNSVAQLELCGKSIKCEIKAIIDKAIPDETTEVLFSKPEMIQNEKEYSISYIAEKGSEAKMLLVKKIED